MKTGLFFLIATCVFITASAQENKKASASLAPSHEFIDTTPEPKSTPTTSATPKSTTPASTTTKSTTPASTTTTSTTTASTTTKPTTTKSTTTASTTTKSTTTASTTTKSITTLSTTTTPTPKTTTAGKTTPATTTNSTTTNATTTVKTTTTAVPVPTPSTNVTTGNYSYSEGDKLVVMALMALQIRVDDDKTGGVFIIQPNKTQSSGLVGKDSVSLTLKFDEGKIVLVFKKNTTSKTVYVNSLDMDLNYAFQKGAMSSYSAKISSLELFKAAIGHSYSCSNESVFLGNKTYLILTQERVQAFNFTANREFGPVDVCKADQPDYTVAIAVGIVLLILIIIVIMAYVCSRRRRTDGYQSL